MTISLIDPELCNGCRLCVDTCPMDVIRFDEEARKAVITYPDDCMICEWCAQDCPEGAIVVDISRNGPLMTSWG
jgi:NAD-dependent dihydropyrimidine dehydrogenase PreA subunit